MAMDHKAMMQRMHTADSTLDRLVADMNRAKGQKKVDAMGSVVNQLVAERKEMHSHMMKMMQCQEAHPGMTQDHRPS